MVLSHFRTSSSLQHPASSSKTGSPQNSVTTSSLPPKSTSPPFAVYLVLVPDASNLDVPLIVPTDPISFDPYITPRGLQPNETALPDDTDATASLPPLNEQAYTQLQEMGFSAVRAEKALRTTGNTDADSAMQWLFEHMEDEDIDVPWKPVAGGEVVVDAEKMEGLMGMGFEERAAKKALQETVKSIPPSALLALLQLLS